MARLDDTVDKEFVEGLRHEFDEAMNKYWENTHLLEHVQFMEAQETALGELDKIYEKRAQDVLGDENELANFKGEYTTAVEEAKTEETKLNQFRDAKAVAKRALDKA